MLSLSPAEMAFADDTRDSRCLLQRWVASSDGQPAGFAELMQSSEAYSPLRFQFRICVLPEQAGKGLEEELLALVVAAFQSHHGTGLRCLLRSGQGDVEKALKKFGFTPSMNFLDRTLDLNAMDGAMIDGFAAAAPAGIIVTTISDILSRPEGDKAIFDLESRVKSDIPYPEDLTMKFEYFAKAILGSPGLVTDGSYVAMDGDRLVGLCYLLRRDGNPTAIIRLTGTHPAYRGKGIALHLKALMIRYARGAGFSSVFTRAEEGNGSINRLNEKLGFKTVGNCVNWSRTF